MLAESTWTRYAETQRQIGMDVPDYMPEGCPGIIVAMQTKKNGEQFPYDDTYDPGDLNCMSFPHGQ